MTIDALIIGAGAAGLAAAAELARAGRSVLMLEARDRIGGRVWTLTDSALGVPVELGAEFIHGRPRATLALLRASGTAAVVAPRTRCYLRDGKPLAMQGALAELGAALQGAARPRRDIAFASFLARNPLRLSADALAIARMRAEGYDAADPARASARAILGEWRTESVGADAQCRPRGGYGPLLERLAGTLDRTRVELRLRSVVRAVRWRRGKVEVEGVRGSKRFRISAARAIVTLPLGVLQLAPGAQGSVRFSPALSGKRAALERLAAGPAIKLVLRFDSAFWRGRGERRGRDAAFYHCPGAAFPTFWTALPERAPLMTAWAGGPNAARLAGAGRRPIVCRALATLEAMFGIDGLERRLEAAWLHDWQRDPYACGAYSYQLVGGDGAREALAAPLRDTLFFAGEATAIGNDIGTVGGALESGLRAARELIAAEKRRARIRDEG
ncbi:MAG TPA: NAD(P)/FAD-dependent oxidoreductase [Burkholderiales bacterium]|nr:NAD(P)/FAD-dependent oxidoreductase [Burkholderiales bacterium]